MANPLIFLKSLLWISYGYTKCPSAIRTWCEWWWWCNMV